MTAPETGSMTLAGPEEETWPAAARVDALADQLSPKVSEKASNDAWEAGGAGTGGGWKTGRASFELLSFDRQRSFGVQKSPGQEWGLTRRRRRTQVVPTLRALTHGASFENLVNRSKLLGRSAGHAIAVDSP